MGRDEEEEVVEFEDCIVKHATDGALLIGSDDETFDADPETGRWVPRSVITDDSDIQEKGDEGWLEVKAWWAKKEGIG